MSSYELRSVFEKFTNLNDDDIKRIVFRDEYIELLDSKNAIACLKQYCELLIGKKDILKRFLNIPKQDIEPPVLSPVFANNLTLSEPIEEIPYGASRPFKVKRISHTATIQLAI